MNSQDFVAAVERYVRDAAIEDTIANLKSPGSASAAGRPGALRLV